MTVSADMNTDNSQSGHDRHVEYYSASSMISPLEHEAALSEMSARAQHLPDNPVGSSRSEQTGSVLRDETPESPLLQAFILIFYY